MENSRAKKVAVFHFARTSASAVCVLNACWVNCTYRACVILARVPMMSRRAHERNFSTEIGDF